MTAPSTMPAPAGDPFEAPQNAFGQQGPALRCIGHRLVVIVPKLIIRQEPNPFYKPAEPVKYSNKPLRDRLVCDMILVSGAPFMYGGNDKDIPDTQGPFPVPGVIHDYEIVKQSIIDTIPPHAVGGGVVLGELYKDRTKGNNDVWTFGKIPAPGSPERQAAIAAYEAYKAGSLPTHKPTGPVANPVQQSFTMPGGAQMPHAGYPQAQPTWPTPAAPMGGAMAPVMNAYAPPVYTPGPQASATPVTSAPPADWTLTVPPIPGFEAMWPGFTAAQREQMLAQAGVSRPTGY